MKKIILFLVISLNVFAQNYIIRQDSLRASEAQTKNILRLDIRDSLNANVRGWQTAQQVANQITDSLNTNARGWQTAQQVSNRITDSLNANARGWQTAQQVSGMITDSLNANARGWQTAQQVSNRITDSLNTNARGWQTAQQVANQITDTLNANSRGWRTQAQVKADAIDTLRNIGAIDNPADQSYILVETTTGLKKSQIYNIPQETRIQQLQSLVAQLESRIAQLEEALQDTTAPTITIPVAPSNLRATTTTTRVNLTWQDNSTNETGFQILRKLSSMMNYVPLDTVASNVTTYVDSTVLPNTYYDYAVKALGSQGNSGSIEVTNVRLDVIDYKFDIIPASLYTELDSTGSTSGGGGGGSYYLFNAESGDFSGLTSYTIYDSAQFFVTNTNPITGTYSYRYRTQSSDQSATTAYVRFTDAVFPDSIWVSFKLKVDTCVLPQITSNTVLSISNGNFSIALIEISRWTTGTGNATHFSLDGALHTFTSLGYYFGNIVEFKLFYYEGSSTDSIATIKIYVNDNLLVDKTKKISLGWGQINRVTFGNIWGGGYQVAYSIDDLRIADNPPDYQPGGTLVYETVPIKLKNNTDSTLTISQFNIIPTNIFFIDSTQNYLVSVAPGDSIERNIKVLRTVNGGSYNASINIVTQLGSQTYSMVALIKSASTTPPDPTYATRWYLSPTGSGNQDGKSRANARIYTNANTLNIQPGDTVLFVEGFYNGQFSFRKNGAPNNLIVLMPDPQNTGEAIFRDTANYAINIETTSYVKLYKLKIRSSQRGVIIGTGKVKFLDSLHISKNAGTGINIYGNNGGSYNPNYDPGINSQVDSVFIRWNYVATDTQVNTQTDCITIYWGHGVRIIGNYIFQGNYTGDGHNDNIQTGHGIGDIYIANNMLINLKPTSSQIFMNGNSWKGYKTVIYNNVSIHYGAGTGMWQTYAYNGWNPTFLAPGDGEVYLINNTLIGKRVPFVVTMGPVEGAWQNPPGLTFDSLYAVNNLIYQIQSDGTYQIGVPRTRTDPIHAMYLDNNIHAISGGTSSSNIGANYGNIPTGSWTLDNWRATSSLKMLNSTTQLPTFRNFQYNSALYDQEDLRLTSNSVGAGAGRTDIKIKGNQWVNLKTLVESFNLQWEEFNNPYVSWATGGARSETTPNIGACSVAP